MSFDIDMKSFAGEVSDPAAVDQPIVDTNSYQQEVTEEFTVPELQEASKEPTLEEPVKNQVDEQLSKQELNFKALREEVDRIKAERETERREHQLQIDMLRANIGQKQQEAPAQTKKMFDGMADDDVPNVREIRHAWEQRESEYQSRIEELQIAQQYPDYAEVIEKYALPLVKQKPHLAEGIQGARNKALYAYELGKLAQQMQQTPPPPVAPQAPLKSMEAQRIVENARKPGTLSQAGGQSVLSKADYYASMSDQEFIKFASRNLDGI